MGVAGATEWARLKSMTACFAMVLMMPFQVSIRAGIPRILVTKAQITREAQDRWAERSQQRFAAAQAKGFFEAEIVPVEIQGRKGPEVFSRDERDAQTQVSKPWPNSVQLFAPMAALPRAMPRA